jgi:hypothetical protein
MTANQITRVISLIGILAALAAIAYGADIDSAALILVATLFAGLNALPFILTCLLTFKSFFHGWAAWAFAAVTLALLGLSMLAYWQLYFDAVSDPQDPIILAVLPIYQLVALGIAVIIIRFVQRYLEPGK